MKNTYRTTDDAGQDKAQLAELLEALNALAFCEVTQDGDAEGCFRLSRLPTPAEAEEIRSVLGIWKKVAWSPEELARRQQWGRRLSTMSGD
jgi:hypothetical protein